MAPWLFWGPVSKGLDRGSDKVVIPKGPSKEAGLTLIRAGQSHMWWPPWKKKGNKGGEGKAFLPPLFLPRRSGGQSQGTTPRQSKAIEEMTTSLPPSQPPLVSPLPSSHPEGSFDENYVEIGQGGAVVL